MKGFNLFKKKSSKGGASGTSSAHTSTNKDTVTDTTSQDASPRTPTTPRQNNNSNSSNNLLQSSILNHAHNGGTTTSYNSDIDTQSGEYSPKPHNNNYNNKPSSSGGGGGEDVTVKMGILTKEGERVRSWKTRHFKLLSDGSIKYYKINSKSEATQLAGTIVLTRGTIVGKAPEKNKKFCFQICTSKRTYYLQAGSELEMNDWMSSIKEVIDNNNNNGINNGNNIILVQRTSDAHTGDDDYEDGDEEDGDDAESSHMEPLRVYSTSTGDIVHQHHHHNNNSPSNNSLGSQYGSSTGGPNHLSDAMHNDDQLITLHALHSSSLHSTSASMDQHMLRQKQSFDQSRLSMQDVPARSQSPPASSSYHMQQQQQQQLQQQLLHHHNHNIVLSEEDEYDIALSAAEIFMKDPADRSPEEQSYVLAMQQYVTALMNHCTKHKAKPEYSLASGTSIFVIPEASRSELEKEYVRDMINEKLVQMKLIEQNNLRRKQQQQQQNNNNNNNNSIEVDDITTFTDLSSPTNNASDLERNLSDEEIPIKYQQELSKRALEIFRKPAHERTLEEREYVNKLRRVVRDLNRLEREHGMTVQHSYLTSTIMLAKYQEERNLEDVEYLTTVIQDNELHETSPGVLAAHN